MKFAVVGALAALMLAGVSRAEVVDKGPQGFRLKTVQQVAAPPETVFKAIGEIGHWWSDDHTYSHHASNMTMPLTPNACFCEALPGGGGVRHGVVEMVIPNQQVRVEAALGPLPDEGVAAALSFVLKPKDGGTELTVTYHVGGARDLMVSAAPVVDGVISEQIVRLKRYIETGKP
ncbi:SRPBCC family protein [Phenylobacterium sp.]|uniref:SRPBCC family protein n=1 Tax=Phenylobacterium sp. TaxID=1871053 RepID=UPI0025CCB022|nr:SRPBCC family protein [Phenylobacterium sp.]